jgi:hypothetical protein
MTRTADADNIGSAFFCARAFGHYGFHPLCARKMHPNAIAKTAQPREVHLRIFSIRLWSKGSLGIWTAAQPYEGCASEQDQGDDR